MRTDDPPTLLGLPRGQRASADHPRGSWEVFTPAPGVCVVRIDGVARLVDVEGAFAACDVIFGAKSGWLVFDDFERFVSYDPGVRECYARWNKVRGAQIATSHMLVRSKIVAMGLTVANVARKRPLEFYANRPRFEAALTRALASAR